MKRDKLRRIRLRSDRWPYLRNVSVNLGAVTSLPHGSRSSPSIFYPVLYIGFLVRWFFFLVFSVCIWASLPFVGRYFSLHFNFSFFSGSGESFSPAVVVGSPGEALGSRAVAAKSVKATERGTGRIPLAPVLVFRRSLEVKSMGLQGCWGAGFLHAGASRERPLFRGDGRRLLAASPAWLVPFFFVAPIPICLLLFYVRLHILVFSFTRGSGNFVLFLGGAGQNANSLVCEAILGCVSPWYSPPPASVFGPSLIQKCYSSICFVC
jgi:hypothetical protein